MKISTGFRAMKVSTKILLGYLILVALMIFGLGYEAILLDRVQSTNERLSEVKDATSNVAQLDETLRYVRELTEKYLTVDPTSYEPQLDGRRRAFRDTLATIEALVVSPDELRAVAQVEASWWEFIGLLEESRASGAPGNRTLIPPRMDEVLDRLGTQIERLRDEVREASADEVLAAEATQRRAQWVAWIVVIAAVGLGGGVGLSVTRSIQGSFRRFMVATAAVAEGEFEKPLPEPGDDEFGVLAGSFNSMAARLEQLDQLKRDFVSSVSHDLKSPIASSREIVQLLLDEVPGPINAEQRRLLELSIRSSRRLSAMVGGLLDLAKMDAGTMSYRMEEQDLNTLVAAALEEFEVAARERDLTLDAHLDPVSTVHCDGDRITQVVGNLVDNAMKFSRRGSRITVRLENVADGKDDRSHSGVMFSIIDEGPGVPDAHKKRVFARFQQVKAQGAVQQGVGLGLAICRSIIDDHGGRIWVEDNPRGGAVFRFILRSEAVEVPSARIRTMEV
jgi:signal transduction histidine kinase